MKDQDMPVWKDTVEKINQRKEISRLLAGCENYRTAQQLVDAISVLFEMEEEVSTRLSALFKVQLQLCMLTTKKSFEESERPDIDYDNIPF